MQLQTLSLDQLQPHPRNSNVMPEPLLAKLVKHIETTDQYPPVIVRPLDSGYQIIDGHHRVMALRRLERDTVTCVLWDVGEAGALVLLATLNRLQGQDDPRKRAALVDQLRHNFDLKELAAQLPEDAGRLKKLLELNAVMPRPRAPQSLDDMAVAVHFFLRPAERSAVERRLAELGGTREEALLNLVKTS